MPSTPTPRTRSLTPVPSARSLLTAGDQAAQRAALGLGSLATQAASSVAITGGTINGTPIGATTPGTGTFTTLTTTGVSYLQEVRAQNALIATSNVGSGGVYVRGRVSDNIGTIYLQNNAGNVEQGFIQSWADKLIISALGSERLRFDTASAQISNTLLPMTDNSYSLGSPGQRWKDIYAANATIQTSDARAKTDIADCPLGLDFLLALRPVRYRFKDIDEPAVTARRTVERAVTAPVTRTREEVRCIDEQHRLVTVEETVEEPVLRLEPLFDAEGQPLLDENGRQRRHPVPVTETVEVEEVVRPAHALRHRRPHDGLIAQEVKAVLNRIGLDMAGYIYDPETDCHGLRYGEFLAPLIRAVQELAARVAALEGSAAPAG